MLTFKNFIILNMSYRREIFKKRASEFMKIDENDIIILNMEKGIFNTAIKFCKKNEYALNWSNIHFTKKYSQDARRILANLSYTLNAQDVREKIIKGIIDPYELVNMSKEELNPEIWEKLKHKTMNKVTIKQTVQEDGIFKCNRCKSMKTVYYQMQIRSADEPMTTFVTCTNCYLKWKC